MDKVIKARKELYDHLKHLIGEEEANQMIMDYEKEMLANFKKVFLHEYRKVPIRLVHPIKCSDGVNRYRPLLDYADTLDVLDELVPDNENIDMKSKEFMISKELREKFKHELDIHIASSSDIDKCIERKRPLLQYHEVMDALDKVFNFKYWRCN